jgi:5-methylcytosine-specific restriction endonuclease McrA
MSDKKTTRAAFRRAVFTRDGHRCRVCGRQWSAADADPALRRLNAHHITDRTELPGGGYVAENGITVCEQPCHPRVERFHASAGRDWEEGLHPDDLYAMIGSTRDTAVAASLERLERR